MQYVLATNYRTFTVHYILPRALTRVAVKLLLATVATLCTPVRFSQIELRPSTMLTISSAIRCASIYLPLVLLFLLLAASRIHMNAWRRRCRRPRGIGICSARPPPAAPWMALTRTNGAIESRASVRYNTGFRGRWAAGAGSLSILCCADFLSHHLRAPGNNGLLGL